MRKILLIFLFASASSLSAVYQDGTVDIRNDGTYILVDKYER